VKFSDFNRWHFGLALFLLLPVGFLLWENMMRWCAIAQDISHRYCSAEQTIAWLEGKHGLFFWVCLGAVVALYAGVLVGLVAGTAASKTSRSS
ncbi:MAG TPA: hypothetical protein VLS52_12065, partial [Rudaea sp.]|nr:hypothetical protein [Rudaea sp.]